MLAAVYFAMNPRQPTRNTSVPQCRVEPWSLTGLSPGCWARDGAAWGLRPASSAHAQLQFRGKATPKYKPLSVAREDVLRCPSRKQRRTSVNGRYWIRTSDPYRVNRVGTTPHNHCNTRSGPSLRSWRGPCNSLRIVAIGLADSWFVTWYDPDSCVVARSADLLKSEPASWS